MRRLRGEDGERRSAAELTCRTGVLFSADDDKDDSRALMILSV